MRSGSPLPGLLVDRLGARLAQSSGSAAATEAAAAALLDRAGAAWPELPPPDEDFLAYVLERLPAGPDVDVAAELQALQAGDLFLAFRCVRRDARALAAFERHFISRVGAFLAREDALPSFTDEVKQTLRARLLVAEGALLPRLGQYGGRGPLGAWLWMITTRIALDLRRAQRGGEVTSDALALLADRTVTPDPELAYLKTHYGAAFRAVFREVLAALPKRDGTLLRLHYLEGMTTEQLGAFYGVSRWTAARRIERLCRSVLKEARRTLAARLDLPTSQLDSVLQLVKSELQLSLADVLGR